MDVQYKSIGKRIKLRRKELNIKQNELAEKLNISNNHLSSVENGREKPSLELLLNICVFTISFRNIQYSSQIFFIIFYIFL